MQCQQMPQKPKSFVGSQKTQQKGPEYIQTKDFAAKKIE